MCFNPSLFGEAMRVLGLDPSLTAFGWAVHDTDVSGKDRCIRRGRFQTSASTLFVDRYIQLRQQLRELILSTHPDRIGIEYPIFNDLFSEGMYGLFLYSCEAIRAEKMDVVFFSPGQVKAHARESLGRPAGWKMMKPDMVEAAIHDTGGTGRWNHNEADAYLVGRIAGRFWKYLDKQLADVDLTLVETKMFTDVKKYTRGKRAGEEDQRGLCYREDERFFQWSKES